MNAGYGLDYTDDWLVSQCIGFVITISKAMTK